MITSVLAIGCGDWYRDRLVLHGNQCLDHPGHLLWCKGQLVNCTIRNNTNSQTQIFRKASWCSETTYPSFTTSPPPLSFTPPPSLSSTLSPPPLSLTLSRQVIGSACALQRLMTGSFQPVADLERRPASCRLVSLTVLTLW